MKKTTTCGVFFSIVCVLFNQTAFADFVIQDQKVTAQMGVIDDQFGRNLDLDDSGNRMVVGAAFTGTNNGSAYIFDKQNGVWIETQPLLASDNSVDDLFGISVTVQGDVAAVGASGESNSQGAAYIFRFDGQNWIEEAKITGSDTVAGAQFGAAMKLDGNYLVVGAINNLSGLAGAVYVFEYDGLSWNEVTKLSASNGAVGNLFGASLDSRGGFIVVGAPNSFMDSGAAYLYQRSGNNWSERQGIVPNDPAPSRFFGISVALGENTQVFAGAVGDNSVALNNGAVYVYESNAERNQGVNWIQVDKLVTSDASANDFFGGISQSISVDDGLMVITAYGNQDFFSLGGAAYLFKFINGTWTEINKFTASDVGNDWRFGSSAKIVGNNIIVGANGADGLTGAVYSLTNDLIFADSFDN